MCTRYLTFADLTGSNEEEAALTYVLPPNPPVDLLELTRKKVLEYQQWRIPELQRTDRRYAAAQLQVVAVRLIEISFLLPAAATIEKADIEKSIEFAANFHFTDVKSLEGFRRLEDHLLEVRQFVDGLEATVG